MYVEHDKLVTAFRKAQQINEEYSRYMLDGSRLPVSVDDLVELVSDMYKIKINMKLVDFQSEHLRGMIEKIGDTEANIYIKERQQETTKRFVTVKELSHVIIDEPEDFNPDGCGTIDGFIEAEQFTIKNGEDFVMPPQYIQGEAIAKAIATEIMFPYEMRDDLHNDVYVKKSRSIMDVCQQFGMPQFAVTRAFSDNYRDIADRVWAEIKAETFEG